MKCFFPSRELTVDVNRVATLLSRDSSSSSSVVPTCSVDLEVSGSCATESLCRNDVVLQLTES